MQKQKNWDFREITNSVEDVIVARDIILAKEITGAAAFTLYHISTKDPTVVVESGKGRRCPGVRQKVCPRHLTLSTGAI